jgi:hypothetical protein
LLGKTLGLLAWPASRNEVLAMKNHDVSPGIVNPRSVSLLFLALAALLLAGLVETAAARPLIGKDGQIHACYRVKGKPKGALRVVRSARTHCRRGERKVAWTVVGAVGAAGQSGSAGAQGSQGGQGSTGQGGAQGAVSSTVTEQLCSLSSRVDSLEATLLGIDTDLDGVLSTLQDVDSDELKDAVAALPSVESLCTQSEQLAEQVNLLQDVVGGLGLEPALEIIGLLEIPELPDELEEDKFGCGVL